MPKPYPDSFFATIASEYVEALDEGKRPGPTIVNAYQCTLTTAHSWIRKARDKGYLTEAVPPITKMGTRTNRKLKLVADALGVDPYDLYEALLLHADGDLRVQRRFTPHEFDPGGPGVADYSMRLCVICELPMDDEIHAR